MNANAPVKRRDLLRALGYMATLGLGWPVSGSAVVSINGNKMCEDNSKNAVSALLAKSIDTQSSARHVGREYLSIVPSESDARVLTERICAEESWGQWAENQGDEQWIRRRLAAQVRRDFAEQRTVILHGWVMSETEARLCALVALS